MLRYFGFFFILFFLVIAGYMIFVWKAGEKTKQLNRPAINASGPQALAVGTKAIRLLDKINTDRTLIGNSEWNKEVEEVLNEWYGK